jgi:hypothetical protein
MIMVAVRWYLRYGLSYRDVEELLAERGIAVDHVTVYRWVQRFTRCWPAPPDSLGTHRATGGSWMRRSAPRGALPYPQRSWEGLGGRFLGLMAYLRSKG